MMDDKSVLNELIIMTNSIKNMIRHCVVESDKKIEALVKYQDAIELAKEAIETHGVYGSDNL